MQRRMSLGTGLQAGWRQLLFPAGLHMAVTNFKEFGNLELGQGGFKVAHKLIIRSQDRFHIYIYVLTSTTEICFPTAIDPSK